MLNMPTLEEFQQLIGRKKGTVKGVIMDQSFSAGVGNVCHLLSGHEAIRGCGRDGKGG
jgi:hypothetical protein